VPSSSKLMLRDIPAPCAIAGCGAAATILHRSKPYCGKHALELIEAGDEIDRSAEYTRSMTNSGALR